MSQFHGFVVKEGATLACRVVHDTSLLSHVIDHLACATEIRVTLKLVIFTSA